VDGNRVYTVGGSGRLLCLETQPSGPPHEVWAHDLPTEFGARPPQWGYAGSPLVDGDQVIVLPGGDQGTVAAFDKTTGALKWKYGSNPAGYSSPVAATVHGVRSIFALTGDAFLCFRADGLLMGSFGWDTRFKGNIATPLVLGDYVFITAAYGQGCALLRVRPDGDRVRLELVYVRRNKPLRCHFSTPVAAGKYLYGFDTENGRLTCLDYIAGTEVEGWDAAEVKKGSLILAGSYLVILTQTGDLVLAEARPDEFRMVAKVPTGFAGDQNWALPVLVDGRLYLRGEDKILCLDARP
jgi:outer membrane protein assembly factor BamB